MDKFIEYWEQIPVISNIIDFCGKFIGNHPIITVVGVLIILFIIIFD